MSKNSYLGELLAEFLGTLILILFGVGVVAQVATTVDNALGDHDSIAWAWGIGVTMGIYVSVKITGGHLNPAVTIALATFKGFPWRKVAPYALAQTLGAFVAALIVRFVYADLIYKLDPGLTSKSQGIFTTTTGNGVEGVTITTAFFDQIVGTAILMFVVLALTTASNLGPKANLAPLFVGLTVVGIGMAWGANAGYAINPARDFGPRLVTAITGYATPWVDGNGTPYFWVPIVGPIIGALVGAVIWVYLIEPYLPTEEETAAAADSAQSS